jgi:pyruvate dehydrogenase E1 component alpha subunit
MTRPPAREQASAEEVADVTAATFQIARRRRLDARGRVIGPLPALAADRESMVAMYRWMVLTRTFDAKAVSLQRTGRLGTFASSLGTEAAAVATGLAMAREDVLVPSFREQGAMLVRGVTMTQLFLYWGGDERGSVFSGAAEDFPVCVPVGTHAPHAVGVALAFKLRREPRVAVCTMGDGATSKGDVYEAMNLAGVWKLPVVFVVVNNEWAISVPRSAQTAAETLAQKAIAAGFDGVQVDGNDAIGVREAVGEAVESARAGHGPTLVEALTYRLADHTTVDDASRYRDDAEVGRRWKEEPLVRFRRFLTERFGWSRDDEEALLRDTADEVEGAAQSYLATSPQRPESMFDHLYENLPVAYRGQRAEVAGEHGGDD